MIEPCYSQIGSAIRANRRSRGLTQQQLADYLGYERFSSVCDLEHGRLRLQVHHLLALADIFEVSVETLLAGRFEERQGMAVQDQEWIEF